MMQNRKRKTGIVIAVSVLLAAIIAGIVFVAIPAMNTKKAAYAEATAYLEEGNYRLAYKGFRELGNYKDAAEQAEAATRKMQEAAQTHINKAKELADMGFNMLAGLYLTAQLADEFQFTTEDYNAMADMIGDLYADAKTLYESAMEYDEKKTTIPMLEFMDSLTSLAQSQDPLEALQILGTLTSAPLVEQLIATCIEEGLFDNLPLEKIAEMAPFWVPIIDQYLAAMNNLNILELVG